MKRGGGRPQSRQERTGRHAPQTRSFSSALTLSLSFRLQWGQWLHDWYSPLRSTSKKSFPDLSVLIYRQDSWVFIRSSLSEVLFTVTQMEAPQLLGTLSLNSVGTWGTILLPSWGPSVYGDVIGCQYCGVL